MLKPSVIALGLLVLAAGCAGPEGQRSPAPGEDCLLGGPAAQPRDNATVFDLNASHLDRHPPLEELFTTPGNPVTIACQEGLVLMEHLASEGADVREGRTDYARSTYLSHGDDARRVTLQNPR